MEVDSVGGLRLGTGVAGGTCGIVADKGAKGFWEVIHGLGGRVIVPNVGLFIGRSLKTASSPTIKEAGESRKTTSVGTGD